MFRFYNITGHKVLGSMVFTKSKLGVRKASNGENRILGYLVYLVTIVWMRNCTIENVIT